MSNSATLAIFWQNVAYESRWAYWSRRKDGFKKSVSSSPWCMIWKGSEIAQNYPKTTASWLGIGFQLPNRKFRPDRNRWRLSSRNDNSIDMVSCSPPAANFPRKSRVTCRCHFWNRGAIPGADLWTGTTTKSKTIGRSVPKCQPSRLVVTCRLRGGLYGVNSSKWQDYV